MIGVDPDLQGRRYAAGLLGEILEWLDQEQRDCYLHTASESNVAIYGHFGFGILGKCSIPGTEISATAMAREV